MGKVKPWWGGAKPPNLKHAGKILARAAGLETVICGKKSPLDRELAAYKANNPNMGGNDRTILSTALYGLARNRDALLKALPEAVPGGGDLLATALYDALIGGDELAPEEILPKLRKLSTLRASLVSKVESGWDEPLAESSSLESLSVLFTIPPEILKLGPWKTVGEASLELNAGRFPQQPQLRVGVSRMSRQEALASLASKGIECAPTSLSPWGIRLGGRVGAGALGGLPVEFQDEGSQLVALSCLPLGRAARVLDYCAGAGGKGLAIAEATGCEVFLYDTDSRRLEAALPRINKSGVAKVATVTDPTAQAPYDLVLVDAPCSSTGTMKRNPDITWKWNAGDMGRFAKTQLSILLKAADLVNPRGLLIYSTCSLLEAENQDVVSAFLAERDDFAAEAMPEECFGSVPGSSRGLFRLPIGLPGYSGDGFFIARLRKTG